MIESLLRGKITKLSLETGLIPSVCPICKNGLPSGKLEEHHWGPESQEKAIRLGNSRRMCPPCNRLLGLGGGPESLYSSWGRKFSGHRKRLYFGDYTWEEQFTLLSVYFRSPRKKAKYPNFDGKEGDWSRFLSLEEEIYERFKSGKWNNRT